MVKKMNKRVLVFGASNSKESINRQLALWAGDRVSNAKVVSVHLND